MMKTKPQDKAFLHQQTMQKTLPVYVIGKALSWNHIRLCMWSHLGALTATDRGNNVCSQDIVSFHKKPYNVQALHVG